MVQVVPGFDRLRNTPSISFCAHAILPMTFFYIQDAQLDPRFSDNPLVTGVILMSVSTGLPIAAANGSKLGTLCIVDRKPRTMSETDLQLLRDLGNWVQTELSLVSGLQLKSPARPKCFRKMSGCFSD